MRFPVRKLIPAKATLAANLHGSSDAGGGRLSLEISIDFATLAYADDELEPSLGWDRAPVPGVRDWRKLTGVRIEGENPGKRNREPLEGAFLLHEWHGATASRIRIGARRGDRFALDAEMVVDFEGWGEADADPAMRVRVRTEAVFQGLTVRPGGRQRTLAAALKLAAAHVELAAYQAPVARGEGSFFLAPRLGAGERSPAVKPVPAPRPAMKAGAIVLSKALSLQPIPAPPPLVVFKPRVAGLSTEQTRFLRTRAPGCLIGLHRSKKQVLVIDGKTKRVVKWTAGVLPDQWASEWSASAALFIWDGELVEIALPSGAATRAWRPGKPDGPAPGVGYLACWGPIACGPERVALCTPTRVVVLERTGAKFRELAEHRERPQSLAASSDGRFLLVTLERGRKHKLLALRGQHLKQLASFTSGLIFYSDAEGGLAAGQSGGVPPRAFSAAWKNPPIYNYYRLAGLDQLG